VTDFISSCLQLSIEEDGIEIAHPLPGRKPTNAGKDVTSGGASSKNSPGPGKVLKMFARS